MKVDPYKRFPKVKPHSRFNKSDEYSGPTDFVSGEIPEPPVGCGPRGDLGCVKSPHPSAPPHAAYVPKGGPTLQRSVYSIGTKSEEVERSSIRSGSS